MGVVVTVTREDEVLAAVRELLPDVFGVPPFRPLDEDDLDACTEPRGVAGHAASFRTLNGEELRRASGFAVPSELLLRVTAARQALDQAGLGRGRVTWHVAECERCRARAVRPGLVVRRALGGGVTVEREYGVVTSDGRGA